MIKAVIFDLDGTLYVGKTPVPGAAERLAELRGKGIKVLFLTNAATRSRKGIVDKLKKMGFSAEKDEVYGGAFMLARYISEKHPGKTVYVVGEKGIFEEFKDAGIETADRADIVAVGLDRHVTYEKLAKAHVNIEKGALFIASNRDHTYPTEEGHLPGAGAIVAALENSSGKSPIVVGKPNLYVLNLIEKDHLIKREEMLMVGDRLETDVAFAKDGGMQAALVLTGSTRKEEIAKRGAMKKNGKSPDFVFDSVAKLRI
ncbi:MAG: HAD-IIA family hydrolase [Candidatus Micrarchaeota archaeon]